MSLLTITLPPDRAEFATSRAAELGLASADELVVRLLDAEDRRRSEQRRIEQLVLEGIESGEGELVTDEWWDKLDVEVFGHLTR